MFARYPTSALVALKLDIAQRRPPTVRPQIDRMTMYEPGNSWIRAFRQDRKRFVSAIRVCCSVCGLAEVVRVLDPHRLPTVLHLCGDCRQSVAMLFRQRMKGGYEFI